MPDDYQKSHSGEEHRYEPGYREKLPGRDQPPKQSKFWKVVAITMTILAVIFAAAAALAYNHIINPPEAAVKSETTVVATPGTAGTLGVQQTPISVTTPSITATSVVPPVSQSNYSAIQPGPGCDNNGGTWTPQGLDSITCGTTVNASANNTRGYLFLQLPNNKAFSANNKIGVIGSPYTSTCVGLDEQDANTGFLAEYCGDGSWFIYSISSDGTIVQTLAKGITSTRTNVDISLTFQGTTLSFSMDSEVHKVSNITSIQPTEVAITYFPNNSGYDLTVNNFSYTVLSN
jgi:hypothetical protein